MAEEKLESQQWAQPKRLTVVVDNESWILPYAQELVDWANANGHDAALARDHSAVREGIAAFYLGCVKITPDEILARNRFNLVVHESDLPEGRGFAPMTWQILEGKNQIPVCLLEAAKDADAGPVYLRDIMAFQGHELCSELRDAQGRMTLSLCQQFLASKEPLQGVVQQGEISHYPRRRPEDSRLDPEKSISDQFELLRVVDNERYPAFFTHRGHRYRLTIEKIDETE